jgi:hypothetical protein
MKKGRATYVFCLVAAAARPRLTRVPAGLPGTGPLRLLDIGRDRYLVVADAPLSRYGEVAIRRGLSNLGWVSRAAWAHETVVERFIDAQAVLPMKLFTLFTSDDQALAHLHHDRRRVESIVKRVGNHYEWGVRVVFGGGAAPGPRTAAARSAVRSGVSYLKEKKAERDAVAERVRRARASVAELYDRLARQSRAARRRSDSELPAHGGSVLLDAAFLVPRPRSRSFRALVARESLTLGRQGCALTLTGPWPPYSFVQEQD